MTIAGHENIAPRHTHVYRTSYEHNDAHLQYSKDRSIRTRYYLNHCIQRTMDACVLTVSLFSIAVIRTTSTSCRPYCIATGFDLIS